MRLEIVVYDNIAVRLDPPSDQYVLHEHVNGMYVSYNGCLVSLYPPPSLPLFLPHTHIGSAGCTRLP